MNKKKSKKRAEDSRPEKRLGNVAVMDFKITAKKLETKRIAIIGSGFVGKAAGKAFISLGHDVSFVDVNEILVEKLNESGLLACNILTQCASDRDIYMVSVMTPTIDDHLDFRFIDSAMANLGRVIGKNNNHPIVVIRSTVLPGTTENRFLPILEKYSGKHVGKDFEIAMNPEFLREVTAEDDFMHPWITVIGSQDPRTADILENLYRSFQAPIVHMSIKEAEMVKYIHNIYNANKISFFNEMRPIARQVGADPDKIFQTVMKSAEASWNPSYGIRDMGPFGGTCLPKDTRAFLHWSDKELKKKTPLLHAVIKVNEDLKNKQYFEY